MVIVSDVISAVAFAFAFLIIFRLSRQRFDKYARVFLLICFSICTFVGVSNVLQYLEVTQRLDPYEDYAELLFIPFFLFAMGAMFARTALERQRTAERALRDSERRYRRLVEDHPEYLCRFTNDGILTFVNSTYARSFGRSAEDCVGRNLFELIPTDAHTQIRDHLDGFSADRQVGSIEHQVIGVDGNARWVRWTDRALFDDSGNLAEFQSIGIDITDQKDAERSRRALELKVQQTQKLESLGVLAGGLAHDFNNLLVGVLGNADLALGDLDDSAPARRRVEAIKTAATRAADLASQMLAYSGKGRFVVRPVDLSRLVRDMAHILEVTVSRKAEMKYDLADDLPAVEADATQLRQVVMNLITNASEALGNETGAIAIRTGVRYCDRECLNSSYLHEQLPEGYYAFFEVADSGSGMDEATTARIFDPFFTTKFTGRGLGLAAVLGIVRGHRGAIRVESQPGRGTSVRILLPESSRSVRDTDSDHDLHADWKAQGTVLLVDDDETVRTVADEMLRNLGFEVVTAADGRDAVETFRREASAIRLVLMDLTMPELDGREAFQEIIRIRPDARVILSSGYNEQDISSELTDKGLAGFIQKPYTVDTLREQIRRVLDP